MPFGLSGRLARLANGADSADHPLVMRHYGEEAAMPAAINPGDNIVKTAGMAFGMAEISAGRVVHADSAVSHYTPGEEVIGEGDTADNYFMVVKGVFRSVKVTRDGRRQIFAFYMPGDMCGLEPGSAYELTIEAVNAGSMAGIRSG